MSNTGQSFWFLVPALAPAAIVATLARLFVPMYIVIYSPFAKELPVQTWLLFHTFEWLWLVPVLLVLAVWFWWPNRNRRSAVALVSGIVSSALVVGLGWWAVHQPQLILAATRASEP